MDYVMIGFVSGHYGEAGLITLAVVVSLIEFGVVMDGVGMAMQPLIGTYFGEKNHQLIKRVMRSGVKAAMVEGLAATAFIWIFARQFCALFGISGGDTLAPSMTALRIVSLGFVFLSASIRRVTIESINGQPFSATDTYAVVTNDFCAVGGDTYYAFANASSKFDTGIVMDEAVMEYIQKELKGTVGSKYASPRGDQTQIR